MRGIAVVLVTFGLAGVGIVSYEWWWAGLAAGLAGTASLWLLRRADGGLEWALGACLGLTLSQVAVAVLWGPGTYEVIDVFLVYGVACSAIGLLVGGLVTSCRATRAAGGRRRG